MVEAFDYGLVDVEAAGGRPPGPGQTWPDYWRNLFARIRSHSPKQEAERHINRIQNYRRKYQLPLITQNESGNA